MALSVRGVEALLAVVRLYDRSVSEGTRAGYAVAPVACVCPSTGCRARVLVAGQNRRDVAHRAPGCAMWRQGDDREAPVVLDWRL